MHRERSSQIRFADNQGLQFSDLGKVTMFHVTFSGRCWYVVSCTMYPLAPQGYPRGGRVTSSDLPRRRGRLGLLRRSDGDGGGAEGEVVGGVLRRGDDRVVLEEVQVGALLARGDAGRCGEIWGDVGRRAPDAEVSELRGGGPRRVGAGSGAPSG